MKKVFVDFHHADLYYALQLMIEKRFGWELYRPLGLEWYSSGHWKYHKAVDVAKQYLEPKGGEIERDGYFECPDHVHATTTKAVTVEQFQKMKFDYIIATVPENTESFVALLKLYQPQAKFIQQVGNQWTELNFDYIKNVLLSTLPPEIPDGVQVAFARQEFDLGIFHPQEPGPTLKIKNFVNCLNEQRDWYLWDAYKKELPEFEWRSYGIGNDDGNLSGVDKVAESMRDCHFTFHVKSVGDGYGHVIHNTFACGKPPIIKGEYYQDRLGGKFCIDNVTCIDIDKAPFQENIKRIKYWSQPENYKKMSAAAFARFKELVDFDREAKEAKRFFEMAK
jgi:hypothetical protein